MIRFLKNIHAYLLVLLVLHLGTPAMGFTQPVESISDDGIAYTIVGEGPSLVFIHGSNLDRRLWSPQVKRFSNDFKVITYDLRGLGSSETPTEPYSNASDLSELLKEVSESKATLIGLSAGSQVALEYALLWPDQVEQLILVSPSLYGYTPDTQPSYLPDLIAALQKQDYDQANDVLLDSPIMTVPSDYEDLVREMVTSSRQWELPYELVQQRSEPVISNLDKIDVPTLILIGEKDISAVKELGTFLFNNLPNADMVTIPEGRHLLNLSHSNAFNKELMRFIEPIYHNR